MLWYGVLHRVSVRALASLLVNGKERMSRGYETQIRIEK